MKKLISLLLILTMLIPMSVFAVEGVNIPFTDVKENHWWYEAIAYCYENELLKGMSETEFGPTVTLTRAMFVQALANFEGVTDEDLKDEASPFTDVKNTHWFYTAVEWARQNGIVGGMSETTFAPNGALTRAQMARLFHQYAIYKGFDTDITADLSSFEDAAKIPEWALDGTKYCVGAELFVGDGGKLTPNATATRAQLATVIMKFHGLSGSSCKHQWSMWMCTIAPTDEDTGIETRICTQCDAQQSRVVEAYEGRIVCWGDSLTQGILTGFEYVAEVPYPERVSELLGVEVLNYGIGSEESYAIAARQGGFPIYAFATEAEPFIIPAEGSVEITIYNEKIDLKYNENNFIGVGEHGLFAAINPISVGGILGEVSWIMGENYRFTRLEPGEEVIFTEHVPIETFGMRDKREDDIVIIWAGHNDTAEPWDVEAQDDVVNYIKGMVENAGTDEYIVLSLISERYVPGYEEINTKIQEYLESIGEAEKYLDVRSYLADIKHLENLGIIPTDRDIEFLDKGRIPSSLYAEEPGSEIHLTQEGYNILAQYIADKIVDLGYLTN